MSSTFAIRMSFASANERLVAFWAVRRIQSVSTSAVSVSAFSCWPEAAASNTGDLEREPPKVLPSRMFKRTPPGGMQSEGREFSLPFPLPRCKSAPPAVTAPRAQRQPKSLALQLEITTHDALRRGIPNWETRPARQAKGCNTRHRATWK